MPSIEHRGPVASDGAGVAAVDHRDRNGLEVLDESECLALLAAVGIGRIGVTVSALPVVLPVDFAVHGSELVFETGSGTKLDAALRHAVVAFEADGVDPESGQWWSVLVRGVARPAADAEADAVREVLPSVRRFPREPGDSHVVIVSCDLISGRRLP